jgi:hypothetical protein
VVQQEKVEAQQASREAKSLNKIESFFPFQDLFFLGFFGKMMLSNQRR